MLILIDADPIVYRCGFASEDVQWLVTLEDGRQLRFEANEDCSANGRMKAWLEIEQVEVLDKSKDILPAPVSHALRATKMQVESIIAECEDHFKEGAKVLMWLSGGKNYRDAIAKVRPYKGNRDPSHKPFHYSAIRDYLRTTYGSMVTNGIEADDAVSIFARTFSERHSGAERLVIATIDKDLDQIPGHHYNYMNKVFYAITNNEAERFFVYQLLAGDITDNICGVWRCGPGAAERIVATLDDFGRSSPRGNAAVRESTVGSSVQLAARRVGGTGSAGGDAESAERADQHSSGSDQLGGRTESVGGRPAADSAEHGNARVHEHGRAHIRSGVRRAPAYWPTVVAAYAASRSKTGCPYAESDPEAVAVEMAQLVKLQEYPGQLWHPHGDLVVPGFAEGETQ